MASGPHQALGELVSQVVQAAGFDLEDLSVQAAGRRRSVRVVIDSDHGVGLDEAAEVSRQLSERLDALEGRADPMGGEAYTLEVTSPGVGRPLTLPRHFRRAAGRLLTLTTVDGRTFPGRVLAADDEAVELLAGPKGIELLRLPLEQIAKAKVEVEFSSPPEPVRRLLAEAGVGIDAEHLDLDDELESDDQDEAADFEDADDDVTNDDETAEDEQK